MKYCFDLDETICATPSSRNYNDAIPYNRVIQKLMNCMIKEMKLLYLQLGDRLLE